MLPEGTSESSAATADAKEERFFVTADDVKRAAKSNGMRNTAAIFGLHDISTDGKPCPICKEGTDRFSADKNFDQNGKVYCRRCKPKGTGDIIGTFAWMMGIEKQGDAIKELGRLLGVKGTGKPADRDLISELCHKKHMPIDAFMQFQPEVVKGGRARSRLVRVKTYDGKGDPAGHFDFDPNGKGYCARNKESGMFFPGRLPQPGETWLITEGGKDPVALIGLGYDAAGLPTSTMNCKFAELFRGVHVILVPDLDEPGQLGAQKSGGVLFGIAASVRVARLPGEIVKSSGKDVRDILQQKDGERLVREAVEAAMEWTPRETEDNPKDGRPEVLVTQNMSMVTDMVVRKLGKLGWETPWIPDFKRESVKVYQRGGVLVDAIATDSDVEIGQGIKVAAGTPRIRQLPTSQIPLRIASACQLIVEREKDEEIERIAILPPKWLVDAVATIGEFGSDIRKLDGVISAPTIRPDGTILQQHGYDAKTCLLYRPNCEFPKIPENPTRDDAVRCAAELLEVIQDVPTVDVADRSAWIAMTMTMTCRQAFNGCAPLFAVTSTSRGSGKSLCVDAASIIAYGRPAARKLHSSDEDEMRKAITATAIEALPAVLFDNVEGRIGGPSIDAAITARTWSDRVLGKSATTGELPLTTVWAATGNNMQLGGDIARRVLMIRLSPMVENPEERTEFAHPNLLAWVTENRPRLAVAVLTILRAYIAAGKPPQAAGTWGSFESWTEIIRGAIVWAGLPDPLITRETAKAEDNTNAVVRMLIGGLLEVDEYSDGIAVRQIAKALSEDAHQERYPTLRSFVDEHCSKRGSFDSSRLSLLLRKFKGKIAGGFCITGQAAHGGVFKWRAEQVLTGGDGGDVGGATTISYAGRMCVASTETHTHTPHVTHIGAHGEAVDLRPPSQPPPPVETKAEIRALVCIGCKKPMRLIYDIEFREWECLTCGTIYKEGKDAAIEA